MTEPFKNNIKRYRQFNRMTQEDLAKRLGVTKTHLAAIERGEKYGSLPLHLKISEVLKVSLDDLLKA